MTRRPRLHPAPADPELVGQLAARLDAASQARLGRSLALFHAELGGCTGCAMELGLVDAGALAALGLSFVGQPQQADVVLVTGPVTHALAEALRCLLDAVPDPKWVVALGGCAIDGGLFAGSYAVCGGTDSVIPVDLQVPGCPPDPATILSALNTLLAANL